MVLQDIPDRGRQISRRGSIGAHRLERSGGAPAQALEKNEFALYCQPILALSGPPGFPMAEVLVRLREEENAMLPPGDFLPVLEHYKLMPLLDRWVVRNVAAAARRRARGCRASRINVSTQTPRGRAVPRRRRRRAEGAAASPPSCLLFEIDEPDVLAQLEAVDALRAGDASKLGCGVLIDGFGRRSVSFAPLKTLRRDFIKVDGSIIRKLLKSEVARNKLNAILRVGQAIGVEGDRRMRRGAGRAGAAEGARRGLRAGLRHLAAAVAIERFACGVG